MCGLIFIFLNKLKVWPRLLFSNALAEDSLKCGISLFQGLSIGRGMRNPTRFNDSQNSSYSCSHGYNLLQRKDTKQTWQRDQVPWLKTGGDSNSPFPIEPHRTLRSPSSELCHACEVLPSTEAHERISAHGFPWLTTQHSLECAHTPGSRRKAGIPYQPHHLHSLVPWATFVSLWRGTLLSSKFPDASQGPTLPAGVFKDSSVGLTWWLPSAHGPI